MIKINHQINEEGINNPVFFETQTYSNFHPLIRARLIFQLRGPSNSPRGRKKNQKTRATEFVTDWSIFSATNLSARIRLNFAAT